ncbi:recombinase family protein [Peribacillus loiseleuriae]|uniref:recombinase family protein n=1 Tax=Peribacillus loiseleuriae TaxID=1679170 RepID=UPI003CCB795B
MIAGVKWNDSTIKLILPNPHYVGDLVQGRSTTTVTGAECMWKHMDVGGCSNNRK